MSAAQLRPISLRLPEDLVRRVEEYGARRAEEERGLELPTSVWVRVLLESGLVAGAQRPEPETATKQVAYRLPDELVARVRKYGERSLLSLTEAVRVLLEAGLYEASPGRPKRKLVLLGESPGTSSRVAAIPSRRKRKP